MSWRSSELSEMIDDFCSASKLESIGQAEQCNDCNFSRTENRNNFGVFSSSENSDHFCLVKSSWLPLVSLTVLNIFIIIIIIISFIFIIYINFEICVYINFEYVYIYIYILKYVYKYIYMRVVVKTLVPEFGGSTPSSRPDFLETKSRL